LYMTYYTGLYERILGSKYVYCGVFSGNASVISGFWIYYSDLLVIHQAELQLIMTLSVFHICLVF
jgi:hypothetical protein